MDRRKASAGTKAGIGRCTDTNECCIDNPGLLIPAITAGEIESGKVDQVFPGNCKCFLALNKEGVVQARLKKPALGSMDCNSYCLVINTAFLQKLIAMEPTADISGSMDSGLHCGWEMGNENYPLHTRGCVCLSDFNEINAWPFWTSDS